MLFPTNRAERPRGLSAQSDTLNEGDPSWGSKHAGDRTRLSDTGIVGEIRRDSDALQRPDYPPAHPGACRRCCAVFAKSDLGSFSYSWEIAGFVFLALALFWIAIWIVDFGYYNKLLIGAVAALLELEHKSRTSDIALEINLSTRVEESVRTTLFFPVP